jgi:hypothetical protein
MKYILLIYLTAIIFIALGINLASNPDLEGPLVFWITLGSAGIIASVYFILYLRLLSNFRKQMKPVEIYGFYRELGTHTVAFIIMSFGAVFFFFFFLALVSISSEDILIPLGAGVFATIFLIVDIQSLRHDGFLAMYFSVEGVHLKSFNRRSTTTILWDECVDIGIGTNPGIQPTPCLYFSKDILTEKQLIKISNVKFSDRFIRIAYSDKAFEALIGYVGEGRIRNLEERKNISWSTAYEKKKKN